MYRKKCFSVIAVLFLMVCTEINGQQQNCIDEADTTLKTVVTPTVVTLGGNTVVQCQVSPTSKDFCGSRITLDGPSGQLAFDKTNCPRGTISEPRHTGKCDVTAGRYGLRIKNVQMTDAGIWRCDYMNSFRNRKIVTVIAPPSGPVLTSQPNTAINNIVTVQENSPLTITCDGSQSGATGLKYKWSGINLSGQSNNKLSFTPVRRTYSGVYTCTASNIAGTVTGSITINVLYPSSSVTLQGLTSPVQESTSVDLTCTATGGNPVPNLAITRTPGDSTVKHGVSPLTYSTSVTKTDNQAEYQCTATGAGIPTPMISNKVRLIVNFQATTLTMVKKPADYVLVNNNQQIECKTDSSNPAVQIQWFIYSSTTWTPVDSQPATSQTSAAYHGFMATGTLSITATKTMNQARYRCQTGNLYKDKMINVHFPPESITLTEIPNGPVVQGTSKTLTCTTDSSNLVSTIVWAYSSGAKTWINLSPNPAEIHQPGSHSGQISTSSLVVPTDKNKNGRQYRCSAYQDSQPVNGVTKSTTLSILHAADSVSLTPVKSVVTEGNSIRFNCAATGGNPDRYTYSWQFSIVHGVWKSRGSTNDYLSLVNSSKADSGQYRCQASNNGGFTISNIAVVDVQYAPKLSEKPEPVAAKIGETVRFTINYDANPQATTLTCSHKFEYMYVGMYWVVAIRSVQASDYGSHSCQLKNSIGTLEITLDILKNGRPEISSNLSILTKTAASVTLSWLSEFAGGSEQTFTLSYRKSDSATFTNKTEIPDPGYRKLVQTTITGLKPATDYQFKVKSVNLNLGDNTSPFTDIVTTRTNAIPGALNSILNQAKITQEGNLVLVKLSSFPSKYSVYVEYCTKDPNQECKSTKPIESTDGTISITVRINPRQSYSYKLILSEGSDVIASSELEPNKVDDKRSATSPNPLTIVGVVFGIIAFVLVVISLLVNVYLIRQLKDGGFVFMNKSSGMKTKKHSTVYSNSKELNDTDSRVYAAATPYVNVAFCELEPDPNNYEEVRN